MNTIIKKQLDRKYINKTALIILYYKQNGECYYCKTHLGVEAMQGRTPKIERHIPKNRGGKLELDNLCLACSFCSSSKCNKSSEEYLEYIKPYLENKCSKYELTLYNKNDDNDIEKQKQLEYKLLRSIHKYKWKKWSYIEWELVGISRWKAYRYKLNKMYTIKNKLAENL